MRSTLRQAKGFLATYRARWGCVILVAVGVAIDARSDAQSPTGQKQKTGVVTGEVVGEDGNPVAGVQVLLRASSRFTATTNDQGQFRMEKVPAGQHPIWAYKDRLCSAKESISHRESPAADSLLFDPVRLVLRVGKEMKVTVTSAASGSPLEGAEVKFGYPDRRSAKTGKDGVAMISALQPETYDVTVQAAGHEFMSREIAMSKRDPITSHSFALAEGGVVRGSVTDETGNPLKGAAVVFRTGGIPYGYYGDSPTTDEQGRFAHQYLPLGSPIEIEASMRDYLREGEQITLTGRNKEHQLVFRLRRRPPGGSITGVITDADGRPIVGASVENRGHEVADVRTVITDKNGRFVLHDLYKNYAGYEIVVRADGFAPQLQRVEPGPANSPSEASVQLEKGHFLRGRVLNVAGEPIPGARIYGRNAALPNLGFESATTDADGKFEFRAVPTGTTFRIAATGYSSLDNAPLKLDQDELITVTLEPMGVLRGRVMDAESSQPVPQFRVRIGFSEIRQAGDAHGGYSARYSDPGMTYESEDGTFTLSDLTNRMPFIMVIEANGYERATLPRVVAVPNADAKPVEIALKKLGKTKFASVVGKIVDHEGKPVAGASLRLIVTTDAPRGTDDNRFNWVLIDTGQLGQKPYVDQFLSSASDKDGEFNFEGVKPEKFLQIVYWTGKVSRGRVLTLGKSQSGNEQYTLITLLAPAVIRGSFDAAVIPNADGVRLINSNDAFYDVSVMLAAGQTQFEIKNVPPGRYQVAIVGAPQRVPGEAGSFRIQSLASRSLVVEAGKNHDVEFTAEDLVKPRR